MPANQRIRPQADIHKKINIFVVEDNPVFGKMISHYLSLNEEYNVSLYKNGKDCLRHFHKKPDIVCVDLGLPDIPGETLILKLREVNPTLPVIVISGQDKISVAVELLHSGIEDYIEKNSNSIERLWNSLIKIREKLELKNEIVNLKEKIAEKYNFRKLFFGNSNALKKTLCLIERAIKTNINVSIFGETGTGKELVAKAIHYGSSLRNGPFIAVNMAAIPSELLESELFGYEKGAFTGAAARKTGKFEEAQGGTLFLDEIAELNLSLQTKILRVIQERELVRLGGHTPIKLNFRLITATHRNLPSEVKCKKFREDLYYRIIGLPIELPPLRDRGNDIILLSECFASDFAKDNGLPDFSFTPEAKQKLLQYNYPGNVRELKAVVELACVMAEKPIITAEEISFFSVNHENALIENEKPLRDIHAEIINHFLKKYNNNVVKVAEVLNVGKSTIYNMLKQGCVIINR